MNALAGHANSFHSYSAEEALAGIAEAGYRYVELSAVPGWTEHVDVHGDPAETRARLEHYGLQAVSISGHSDLTTDEGLEHGLAVVRWAERFAVPIVNTAIGGHAHVEESEDAFMANIGTLADAAQAAGLVIALEIHGDLMASGEVAIPLLDRIAHPAVKVNYDTANVEHYSGARAEDDLPKIADRVANVHLKDMRGGQGDWDFPAIGEGHVDFGRVLEILSDAGYEGPYAVEIEFTGEPWPPLPEVVEAMRSSREALERLGLS
jgi:sugar phosphate isomerase/epimerase